LWPDACTVAAPLHLLEPVAFKFAKIEDVKRDARAEVGHVGGKPVLEG